jgi:signal transduction histidine kinase
MNLRDYLKDRLILIVTYFLIFILIVAILLAFQTYDPCIIMVIFLYLVLGGFLVFYDYTVRKKFYNEMLELLNKINNKTLLDETLDEPSFLEGKILIKVLRETNRYKIEEINKYKFKEEEFEEFMEMWVHEIKTPLSVINLIHENNKNKVTDSINEEALKIENYIELVLFYERSQMPEKDYIIKEINLEDVIKKTAIRNKNSFILKNINLDLHDLDINVYSDGKWLDFILNQIITNSIKYTLKNGKIEVYTLKANDKVNLYIKDNGIGIDSTDLPRVFDKGFTGKNGRSKYNSTGMGLYLVKKLCDKLDHGIFIASKKGEGTVVTITFPISSLTKEIMR